MNITTDAIVSNSTVYQKKVKEAGGISHDVSKSRMAEKLIKDFASVASEDSYIKNKIKTNNERLIAYENDFSRNQFVESKLAELAMLEEQGQSKEAWDLIATTSYEGKMILAESFNPKLPLADQIAQHTEHNEKERLHLDSEFATLQIVSQNLSSVAMSSMGPTTSSSSAESLVRSSLDNIKINSERVMNLIS